MKPDDAEQALFNDTIPDGEIVDDQPLALPDDGEPQRPVYRERMDAVCKNAQSSAQNVHLGRDKKKNKEKP